MFDRLVEQAFESAADRLMDYAVEAIRNELRDQGHVLTGSLLRTMRVEVQRTTDAYTGKVNMNQYFQYLDRSLPADKVPYRRGSGSKSSKAVAALERYWRLRGLAPKEARSATFATLNKWKQEGRPTRASFRFSKNGRRTGFLQASVEKITADAGNVLSRGAKTEIEKALVRSMRAAVRRG